MYCTVQKKDIFFTKLFNMCMFYVFSMVFGAKNSELEMTLMLLHSTILRRNVQ